MPVKNKERNDLNTYKVYFIGGKTEEFHTSDKLIQSLAKPDKGGYHPIASAGDEWLINMSNVLFIVHPSATEPEPSDV